MNITLASLAVQLVYRSVRYDLSQRAQSLGNASF
jgi:hypothetical protein